MACTGCLMEVPFMPIAVASGRAMSDSSIRKMSFFWDTRLKKYAAYPRIDLKPTPGPGGACRMFGYAVGSKFNDFPKFRLVLRPDQAIRPTWTGTRPPQSNIRMQPTCTSCSRRPITILPLSRGEIHIDGPVDIQFAASRDGSTWTRTDRRPVVGLVWEDARGMPDRFTLDMGSPGWVTSCPCITLPIAGLTVRPIALRRRITIPSSAGPSIVSTVLSRSGALR